MEETESQATNDLETPEKKPGKRGPRPRRERGEEEGTKPPELSSGGRRTRSQAAPDWTSKEAMILVNEIAAVEGDCRRALSSYQKWKIVTENCASMDVFRTLNQCRGKWNSLIGEYSRIRQFDLMSEGGSYWVLDVEKKKELGLPEDFDPELFKAIDVYVSDQMEDLDTDPGSDPDAEADFLDKIAKLGTKRKKRRSLPLAIYANEYYEDYYIGEIPQEILTEEGLQEIYVEENPEAYEIKTPQTIPVEEVGNAKEEPRESRVEEILASVVEEPQEIRTEKMPQQCCETEKTEKTIAEETRGIHSAEEKPRSSQTQRKTSKTNKKELLMVEKLRENAELIIAIVNGNLPEISNFAAADFKNVQDFQTCFARQQADKLISCMGDIVNTLNQFPSLFRECE